MHGCGLPVSTLAIDVVCNFSYHLILKRLWNVTAKDTKTLKSIRDICIVETVISSAYPKQIWEALKCCRPSLIQCRKLLQFEPWVGDGIKRCKECTVRIHRMGTSHETKKIFMKEGTLEMNPRKDRLGSFSVCVYQRFFKLLTYSYVLQNY